MVALKTILKEIDSFMFDESLKLQGEEKKKYAIKQYDTDRRDLDQKWDHINRSIKDHNSAYVEPKIPFRADALICDYNFMIAYFVCVIASSIT